MIFKFSYQVSDLLFNLYSLSKSKINNEQSEIIKKQIVNIMAPVYSEFGYTRVQMVSEPFIETEWHRINAMFSDCWSEVKRNGWEEGSQEERRCFNVKVTDFIEQTLAFLRDQQQKNKETAMARHLVYYSDLEFVVWHSYFTNEAYRLHSYCYDMRYNPEGSYEKIKNDPYHDVFDYHFYCRTEPTRTQLSFNPDWFEEWDDDRFERVQKLIEKMPGAYTQYFNPQVN